MTRGPYRLMPGHVRRGMEVLIPLAALVLVVRLGTAQVTPAMSGAYTPANVGVSTLVADTISAEIRARGDSIFQGKLAGGMCFTCHGQNGKGMPGLGPDLTDAKWLHGDGSMTFLTKIITSGVMTPKQSAAVMPPGGGTSLTADQVTAVAAYVYSLSHKTAR